MRILDMHTHIYPEKIAEKATAAIGKFYDAPMRSAVGCVKNLLEGHDAAGIERSLVFSAATTPLQVASINDFIANTVKENPDKLSGFGTLHPDMDNIEEEADRMISLGLQGVKLHPDFQKFGIDEKRAMKIYEVVEGRLPVLFHTGDRRFQYSNPQRVANIIKVFPKLKIIAAHFGGYSEWDDAARYLADEDILIDTSSTIGFIGIEETKKLVKIWGTDRLMFGTDFPMWDPAVELEDFCQLGIEGEALERVLWKNGAQLLGLE